ncbi:MAG: MFS transporter, partial [Chthoniobacterales bacterium]
MKIKINVDIKVGHIVKYFVLADLLLLFGWGFVDPIFSIFVIERVPGATLVTVGIAAAVYWILKSLLQIPISNFLDRTPGERDDFITLICGLFLAGFSALAYPGITAIWELFVVQIFYAIAFALYIPSWSAIFSRHLDKERVSFDWSLDSTAAGLSYGVSGLLAGIVAAMWGFTIVFIMASVFSFLAALMLIIAPDLVFPKPVVESVSMKDKTPAATAH